MSREEELFELSAGQREEELRIASLEQLVADYQRYVRELDAQYGYAITGAAERFRLLRRADELLS